MKELPDEKTLLELLALAKDFEQKAREMCGISTAIALKYQRRMRQIREAGQQQAEITE